MKKQIHSFTFTQCIRDQHWSASADILYLYQTKHFHYMKCFPFARLSGILIPVWRTVLE